LYATLDNVDPASIYSPCVATAFIVPSGWAFANNSVQTRSRITNNLLLLLLKKIEKIDVAELGLPWGGCDLVLGDGSRVAGATGRLLDGYPYLFIFLNNVFVLIMIIFRFGVMAQHLIEKVVENGVKAHYANCTSSTNQRVLITKLF
jgi:hypothetical protein